MNPKRHHRSPLEQPAASEQPLSPHPPTLDVNQAVTDDSSKADTPAAHINRSPTPPKGPDAVDKDPDMSTAPERAPSSEASAEAPHSPDPSVSPPAPAEPTAAPTPPAPTATAAPAPAQPAPAVPPAHTNHHLPLTMVQTTAEAGQNLTARQLGQRARRARERELQAQGLYTPKRRTSSSATMPDLSHAQAQIQAPSQLPSADVTMQSADEDGDDDGEGELESEVAGSGSASGTTSTPSVPPHSASHLIPPIAVLAPVTTPSRASLAQRARRERERASRLGLSPTSSPNDAITAQPPSLSPQQPIPFNPNPGHQQPPPTLTRGQLAQRARRARERVERAAKAATASGNPPGENWTPSLNSTTDGSGGMSSAGEAVFAVAPPPPGFSAQVGQTSPQAGYGVGLGAAHVPQQLNRAQLAQRARRARERQQRLAAAATHASGVPPVSSGASKDQAKSDSSSVPPVSPSVGRNDSPARTSLSPMTSSTANTPAPLNIASAQFTQVFQSLTAGDNGVSRAVADSGAGVLTAGGRTSSPAEKITSAPISKSESIPKVEEPMEIDQAEDNVDQLSEEAPTPTPAPAPAPAPARDPVPAVPLRPPTPPIQTTSPKPQPEVHRSAIQSVGA
ncbi:hypothetical protein OPQ81_007399 [Rhizoctonia solani]|nr:hypothetical protein OPQ81_007399 [Rhizoctonia solani]